MIAASTQWQVGLALGIVVIAVAAVIVITIVAARAAGSRSRRRRPRQAVEVVRAQTAELGGIAQINDSGVRILHAARSLRKVAVGK